MEARRRTPEPWSAPEDAASGANDNAISFQAEVVSLLPRGSRAVRLANGHILAVLASLQPRRDTVLVGDAVTVELGWGPGGKWRLAPGAPATEWAF